MSLYDLKPKFREQLSGITYYLYKNNITPNQITSTAIILSVLYGIGMLFFSTLFLFFPLFVFFRMALNAIDGLMASTYNMKSDLGFILNEVGDIVSDFFLFLPFCFYAPLYFFIPFIFLTILTELYGIAGIDISGKRHYQGPMGKSDRVFVFGVLALFIYFIGNIPFSFFVFLIINILLMLTIHNRIKANYV